jgi:hypothetical protein
MSEKFYFKRGNKKTSLSINDIILDRYVDKFNVDKVEFRRKVYGLIKFRLMSDLDVNSKAINNELIRLMTVDLIRDVRKPLIINDATKYLLLMLFVIIITVVIFYSQ